MVNRGIDLSTDAGQNEAWKYLSGIRDRVNREVLAIEQRARSGKDLASPPAAAEIAKDSSPQRTR